MRKDIIASIISKIINLNHNYFTVHITKTTLNLTFDNINSILILSTQKLLVEINEEYETNIEFTIDKTLTITFKENE